MNINKNMENILGFVNQLNQQRMLNGIKACLLLKTYKNLKKTYFLKHRKIIFFKNILF